MSKLTNLMNYYTRTRRVGHTTLMTQGIYFERPAIMLFASNNHAQIAFREALDRLELGQLEDVKPDFGRLRIGKVWFKGISMLDNIEEMMRGYKPEDMPAIVVDHFAMDILVRDNSKQMQKLIGAKA